ncbi:MAG: GNAT family N-acetyltransferase, partial [Burkholderiales bacterium]
MSADLVAPYAIVDATNPPRLDDVRRLFRDYADWIGVDLGFQDFEQELKTLPGKYAPPGGRLLLLVRGPEAVGCIALRKFD